MIRHCPSLPSSTRDGSKHKQVRLEVFFLKTEEVLAEATFLCKVYFAQADCGRR